MWCIVGAAGSEGRLQHEVLLLSHMASDKAELQLFAVLSDILVGKLQVLPGCLDLGARGGVGVDLDDDLLVIWVVERPDGLWSFALGVLCRYVGKGDISRGTLL